MISPLMIRTSPGWLPLSVLVGKFYMVYLSLHLLIYIHDFDDGGRKQTMMHLVFLTVLPTVLWLNLLLKSDY